MAIDTLDHLPALHVTPVDVGDREAVARLAADIQNATGDAVSLAYVDQGYAGEAAADAAASLSRTTSATQPRSPASTSSPSSDTCSSMPPTSSKAHDTL